MNRDEAKVILVATIVIGIIAGIIGYKDHIRLCENHPRLEECK